MKHFNLKVAEESASVRQSCFSTPTHLSKGGFAKPAQFEHQFLLQSGRVHEEKAGKIWEETVETTTSSSQTVKLSHFSFPCVPGEQTADSE